MVTSIECIEGAGKEPGIQIWRVEKFELSPVPKNAHGTFFTGDSYIVLHTRETKSGALAWNLHYWQGTESTQDETGAVAIWSVEMDNYLKGAPVQHREVQGYESALFSGHFRPAIHYRDGGFESGFTHAETNEIREENMLLRVKGRRPVRTQEVQMTWKSLTEGDSYIFDMGADIYLWCGPTSNPFERNKAVMVANALKDERQGRANFTRIESNQIKKMEQFLGAYPGSIRKGDDDDTIPKSNAVKLFQLSDDSGSLQISQMSDQPPFNQSELDSGNVFVVTNAQTNHVYVWKGKGSSKSERMSAGKLGKDFLRKVGMHNSSGLSTMAEGGETSAFKTMFKEWKTKSDQEGLGQTWSINKIAKVSNEEFDISSLHDKPEVAAEHQLPDDGSGKVSIWRVESFRREPVRREDYGQFYGGDCYVVMYTPRQSNNHILYYWIGAKASRDEVTALPLLTKEAHEKECDENSTQIRVTQGKEPTHMMMLFDGKPLVVHMGGTSRGRGQSKAADTKLFHIKSFVGGRCRAVEVKATASNLNSNDSFLLITPRGSYSWIGQGASDAEVRGCTDTANALGTSAGETVQEGEEPGAFWNAIGGKEDYSTDPREETPQIEPRLFECSNASGRLTVEEIGGDWVQSDLNPDNVMMLDAWSIIYVWIGKSSNEEEQIGAMKSVGGYLKSDPSDRDEGTATAKVDQGKEPLSFKGFFQGWDDGCWN